MTMKSVKQLNYLFVMFFLLNTRILICLKRKAYSISNLSFNDKITISNPLLSITCRSLVECTKFCLEFELCLSYFYHPTKQECRLFGMDIVEGGDLNTEMGWKYYYFIKDCPKNDVICPVHLGYIYKPYTCGCYKYYPQLNGIDYNAAVATCISDGGELVKVDRMLKQVDMELLIGSYSVDQVRIQGKFLASTWYYENGDPITFFNWNTDQPESQTGLAISKDYNYLWHDVSDGRDIAFICEIGYN